MKSRKLRGSSTAGRGSGKRSRSGAGRRGGRGRAGGGKRGQQNFASIKFYLKETKAEKKMPLNLSYLQSHLDKLKRKGIIQEKDGKLVVDITRGGEYTKICGKFKGQGLKLSVYGKTSKQAKENILQNGGEVNE